MGPDTLNVYSSISRNGIFCAQLCGTHYQETILLNFASFYLPATESNIEDFYAVAAMVK